MTKFRWLTSNETKLPVGREHDIPPNVVQGRKPGYYGGNISIYYRPLFGEVNLFPFVGPDCSWHALFAQTQGKGIFLTRPFSAKGG